MDWTATILVLAGVRLPDGPALGGVSLRRALDEPGHTSVRPMFWRMKHRAQRAYRNGDWKYLKVDEHEYLFDLEADARERANQARSQPERLAAMRAEHESRASSMPPIPPQALVDQVGTLEDMPRR